MTVVNSSASRAGRLLDRAPLLSEMVRRPLGAAGVAIVAGFLLVVVFANILAPYDYARQDMQALFDGPSVAHLLGTDHLGRDLLSRLIYGSRIALGTAVPALALALVGGILLGLTAGYLGGLVDDAIVVLIDAMKAFPAVVLALAILALLGPSRGNAILVIGIAWIPNYARVIRAQVLSARQQQYVEAGRSLGMSKWRIAFRHILPNILAAVLVLAAMDLPVVITFEAGLSFLGLGVRPPEPSWGVILSEGFTYIRRSPWPITWAGLTLVIITLGFALFGETLRDVLDPKLSGTRGL